MSWSKQGGRSGPRGYHHGNLKEALIRAALELIAQKGPAGFTFAEAARWAGVSPAAPYRHFRDRDELLVDVARRGFDQFEVTLARAWGDGRPDAFTAFERVGKAYLRFAKSEPAYYSAMFEAGIPPEASPELRDAGERTFAVLRTATEQLVATIPAPNRPPVLMMTLHIWAMSHGIASLFGRGDAARRSFPMSPEDLLEAAVLIYLRWALPCPRPTDIWRLHSRRLTTRSNTARDVNVINIHGMVCNADRCKTRRVGKTGLGRARDSRVHGVVAGGSRHLGIHDWERTNE
jgi:AcrR family transcriptional regulator